MDKEYLNTKVKHLSQSALATAIKESAGVGQREALKLARMYWNLSDQDGEETLGEVLANLEVDADIQVLETSQARQTES